MLNIKIKIFHKFYLIQSLNMLIIIIHSLIIREQLKNQFIAIRLSEIEADLNEAKMI